jgi:hypothetical protein
MYRITADNSKISELKAIGPMGEEFAMTSNQIAIEHLDTFYSLGSNEFMQDLLPCAAHASLYASYLLLRDRGWANVRDMIVADICGALDLGASRRATDLLMVLRMFLFEHPEFTIAQQCNDVAHRFAMR